MMNPRLQILVVDDDPEIRAFVGTVLRDEGWEVSEAESAEQASETSDPIGIVSL